MATPAPSRSRCLGVPRSRRPPTWPLRQHARHSHTINGARTSHPNGAHANLCRHGHSNCHATPNATAQVITRGHITAMARRAPVVAAHAYRILRLGVGWRPPGAAAHVVLCNTAHRRGRGLAVRCTTRTHTASHPHGSAGATGKGRGGAMHTQGAVTPARRGGARRGHHRNWHATTTARVACPATSPTRHTNDMHTALHV